MECQFVTFVEWFASQDISRVKCQKGKVKRDMSILKSQEWQVKENKSRVITSEWHVRKCQAGHGQDMSRLTIISCHNQLWLVKSCNLWLTILVHLKFVLYELSSPDVNCISINIWFALGPLLQLNIQGHKCSHLHQFMQQTHYLHKYGMENRKWNWNWTELWQLFIGIKQSPFQSVAVQAVDWHNDSRPLFSFFFSFCHLGFSA